ELAGLHVVELLARALTDIADPDVAGGAIERPPPRVAQSEREDLGLAAARGKRDGGRDAVLLAERRVIHVEAQDLAEQRFLVRYPRAWIGVIDRRDERLRVAIRIVCAAAVAGADVEVTVGA